MYGNMDVGANTTYNITADASIWTQVQMNMANLKLMVAELQSCNEKLHHQISNITAESSKEMLSPFKKPIRVKKETARTIKIHKPYLITIVCGVNILEKIIDQSKTWRS